ncbi:hypothetical protein ACLOJK_001213 [Asimina triloba]
MRGYLHKSLTATLEFIIETDRAGGFRISGKVCTQCSLLNPISGDLTVEASAVPIHSIDILLLRIESILVGDRVVTETSVIADGDVCRSMTLPIHVMIPRLLACPIVLAGPFSIEFQLSIVISFQSELSKLYPKSDLRTPRMWLAMETLPLKLYRTSTFKSPGDFTLPNPFPSAVKRFFCERSPWPPPLPLPHIVVIPNKNWNWNWNCLCPIGLLSVFIHGFGHCHTLYRRHAFYCSPISKRPALSLLRCWSQKNVSPLFPSRFCCTLSLRIRYVRRPRAEAETEALALRGAWQPWQEVQRNPTQCNLLFFFFSSCLWLLGWTGRNSRHQLVRLHYECREFRRPKEEIDGAYLMGLLFNVILNVCDGIVVTGDAKSCFLSDEIDFNARQFVNRKSELECRVGFDMIDMIAQAEGISVSSVQFKALFGKGSIGNVPVMLAKPQTFMNASGESVGPLLDFAFQQGLEAVRILVLQGFDKSATFVNSAKSMKLNSG